MKTMRDCLEVGIAFMVVFFLFTPFGWMTIHVGYNSLPSISSRIDQEQRQRHHNIEQGSTP